MMQKLIVCECQLELHNLLSRNRHEQAFAPKTMKIIKIRIGEGSSPQGLSEARLGKEVFAFTVPKTAAGASLFGAAAFIIIMRKPLSNNI